ncbi:MAG: hypothetical protein JWR90_2507 [Marmoricola sp.]|jgi:hypothetical protein|nr:hypothetical protein [Marmoricola sp.]
MKLVLALWDADHQQLLGEDLRITLRQAGATRLQLNLDDDHIPDEVLRLEHFDEPLTSVVSVWADRPVDVVAALRPYAARIAGWQVEERQPLVPPDVADGARLDGLAQVAFLRKPAELEYADWQTHWQGPHTQVAMDTQATFGYVQNRVTDRLTDDTPAVDAIVEELFPAEAMHDIHAYYGSNGDNNELDRRLMLLMESVARMGADHDLDVVATSHYAWDLSG